jgi:hypothetical protein
MNVNPISLVSSLWQTASSSNSSTAAVSATASAQTTDNTSMSGQAQLFAKLQQLSQTNPTQFQSVTSQIAQQLQAAASKMTDSAQANQLIQMATNFLNASKSGNFSDLFSNANNNSTQIQPGQFGHHHHHPISSQSSAGVSIDGFNAILQQALSSIQS